jgi:hypothetical protein
MPVKLVKKKKILPIIGRSDIVDVPDLGLHDVDVKIDTGAYTSSIHCSRIKVVKDEKGQLITFTIPGSKLHEKGLHHFKVRDFEQRQIRSSNGHLQLRYVVRSHIVIYGKSILTEFSLADRSSMKYPILLGRKLLSKRFMVDVSKTNLSYQASKKKTETSSTPKQKASTKLNVGQNSRR